jgi:hypothetical protein
LRINANPATPFRLSPICDTHMPPKQKEYGRDDRAEKAANFISFVPATRPDKSLKVPAAMMARGYTHEEATNRTLQVQVCQVFLAVVVISAAVVDAMVISTVVVAAAVVAAVTVSAVVVSEVVVAEVIVLAVVKETYPPQIRKA